VETRISSTQNEFVKMAKTLKTKKGRNVNGAFLVEGEKCVRELITHMPDILSSLIVSSDQHKDLQQRAVNMGRRVYAVEDHVMEAISDCKTPQDIAAVALKPLHADVSSGFIVALDGVQDPQNVGTIIRTADAAGCACVVLSEESADCFSPKAVRASMGSIFHLPVLYEDILLYTSRLLSRGYRVACADIEGTEDYSLEAARTCLVIGNEAHGMSEEMLNICTDRIRIPMYGQAESLNAAVAAGILIYKIRA
jgi:TrmH family RNA methyltransferase